MLNIKSVKLKNFLSFGNSWSEIDVVNGISFIKGYDVDLQKSNGAGKSSLLESIAFGLFGTTLKEITLGRIVNWKNKRNCQVKIKFEIDEDEYEITRGTKPSKLEILKNGLKLDENKNKKDFQQYIEKEILGLDFKTFSNLIYYNPNNMTPILKMNKPAKREFLENLFDLDEYNSVRDKLSEKIKTKEATLRDIEDVINEKNGKREYIIADLDRQTIDTSFERDKERLEGVKNSLKEGKSVNELKNEEIELEKSVKELENVHYKRKEKVVEIQTTLNHIKNSIKEQLPYVNIDIEAEEQEYKEIKEEYDTLIEQDVDNKQKEYEEKLDTIEVSIKEEQEIVKELENSLIPFKVQLESLPKVSKLENETSCPTCGQSVEYDVIKEDVESSKEELNTKIQEIELKIKPHKENIDVLKKDKENTSKSLKVIQISQRKISKLLEKINNFSDLNTKREKKKEAEVKLEELNTKQQSITSELSIFESALNETREELSRKESRLTEIKNNVRLKEELQIEKERLEERISLMEKTVSTNEENKKRLEDELTSINTSLKSLKKEKTSIDKVLEYLYFTKKLFKDENIKQFVISNRVPYLNERANHYLNEAGFPFYMELDGWLDVVFRGPGIGDSSYGNFSSGEQKAIELALRFACNDLATNQKANIPNTLILDEIIDSSIDANGLDLIMKLIEIKQQEDNLAVFVISHREEIEKFSPKRVYYVKKENGFSKIEIEDY